MFKKLVTIIVAGFMSIGFLVGCNLVQIDTPKYYNQIVAEVSYKDKSKSFTMKDLLNAYNTYGQQFMQNGAELEDAVKSSLDTLIDRYVFIERIKEIVILTDAEINQIKRETYESINNSLQTLEAQIRQEWGRDALEEETETEEAARMRAEHEPYEQNFELINGELVKIEKDEDLDLTPVGEFEQIITEEDISAEALQRFHNSLRRAARTEGRDNLSNSELFEAEIERIYEILEENKYIEKFQEFVTKGEEADVEGVVNLYKQHYKAQKELFENNIAEYHKAVRSNAGEVYYHPVSDAYLNVTHILVKLSPEQNKQIADLKKELQEAGENNEQAKEIYEYKLEQIKLNTVVNYEQELENGEFETNKKALEAVYLEVLSAVNGKNNLVEKAKEFDKFLYLYNDDEGIMNKEFPYAVNLNNDGGANIMIEPFTIAAQKLHTEGKEGDISEPVFAEYAEGQFGFHIIMNLGVVGKNSFASETEIEWINLWNTRVQPSSEKRIFNVLHDQLAQSQVEKRMNELVQTAKGQTEVKLYESRYKSLWS